MRIPVVSPVLDAALAAVTSVASPLLAPLDRIGTVLDAIEQMERQMTGMRSDLASVIEALEGLHTEVRRVGIGVDGIRDATTSLDRSVESLRTSLESVDALATRFGRFGRRRGIVDAESPA